MGACVIGGGNIYGADSSKGGLRMVSATVTKETGDVGVTILALKVGGSMVVVVVVTVFDFLNAALLF